MSIFLRLPGRFYGAESCFFSPFHQPLLEGGGTWRGSIPQFFKKWPADGAAALAAPKASRAALAKRHLNKQEGN